MVPYSDTRTDRDLGSIQPVDLYKIALDEYRFEVKLNADRTVQYLGLNAALLSAGVGLLRFGAPGRSTLLFVGLIFICGVGMAMLGAQSVRKGHEYYRRTCYKKTLIEQLLGLHDPVPNYPGATLAVTTTGGQRDVHRMLDNPDAWHGKPMSLKTITGLAVVMFCLFAVANCAGIAALIYQYIH